MSSITLINCSVNGFNAIDDGGIIYSQNQQHLPLQTIRMINSTFSNNTAPNGGVIFSNFTRIEIENCTFIGNEAEFNGGVIY